MTKDVPSQIHIDKIIKKMGNQILKTLHRDCITTADGTYFLGSMTHDLMRMSFSIISRNAPRQEAKAAFKILMDEVLLDYGMSVVIHEFN